MYTSDQLLGNVRNITASYKISDLGLYLFLSKFIVRIEKRNPDNSIRIMINIQYGKYGKIFTILIPTMYDV